MSRALDVLVVGAVPLELETLRLALGPAEVVPLGRRSLLLGSVGALRVGLVAAGLGKANAAMGAAGALAAARPGLVLSVGVGGAYPAAGLAPGDLAVATEEIYGDEGVETEAGFRGVEEIGIPLWEAGGRRFFNRFPADPGVAEALAAAATRVARVAVGPFVTVSTVTGTAGRARELSDRWAGVCENMEGAAVAHAAAVAGVAFAEVRGISNPVGPRDRPRWNLAGAAAAAGAAAVAFLQGRGRGGAG